MTQAEIDALTKEQLLQRMIELESLPPNDWHSWMDAMLHIVLHDYPVEIVREFLLGNQPPRADFLVLMKKQIVDLGLQIFRIFWEHNIIEFKNPGDTLSVSVIWKCIGYEEAKRRDPKMARTLMNLLKPEIDEKIGIAVRDAVSEDRQNMLYQYFQDGKYRFDFIPFGYHQTL